MRVLLVDDEKELVSTLAERLGYRGIEAEWATGAIEALEKARKQTFDIAVLDVKMPEIDGFTLKRHLQKENPKMKFIFITGHGSENYYYIGSAETGKDFYLVKPVDITTLIEKMNQAMEKQGAL